MGATSVNTAETSNTTSSAYISSMGPNSSRFQHSNRSWTRNRSRISEDSRCAMVRAYRHRPSPDGTQRYTGVAHQGQNAARQDTARAMSEENGESLLPVRHAFTRRALRPEGLAL